MYQWTASLPICLKSLVRNSYFTCSHWHKQYLFICSPRRSPATCLSLCSLRGGMLLTQGRPPPSPGRSLTSFRWGLAFIIYGQNTLHCKAACWLHLKPLCNINCRVCISEGKTWVVESYRINQCHPKSRNTLQGPFLHLSLTDVATSMPMSAIMSNTLAHIYWTHLCAKQLYNALFH